MKTSLLARTAVAIVGVGFVVFLIGVFPNAMRLDETPGIGLLQIITFLFGITLMTLGASMYMYATRHRTHAPRLREDVGVRLMATGVVIAYVAGLADILGIGSHFGAERPLFGPLQAYGVAGGVFIILIGIAMYASPRK
jgi:hypothetical protein